MLKVGSKVYVKDWGKRYTSVYTWEDGERITVFPWKTEIPPNFDTMFHWDRTYEPVLTAKGLPRKDRSKKLVSEYPKFKDYQYQIREMYTKLDGTVICLLFALKTPTPCVIQVALDGVCTMTPAEQERVKHLEQKASMQALAIANLGMWRITDDLSKFPHELRKEIYDRNQSVLFGSSMTKGTIKYHYIPKDYTVNGVPLLINWSCAYDGGCDLEGKQVVSWHELEKIFTENKFK